MKQIKKNDPLFISIKAIIENAKREVARNINTAIVFTNFHIGKRIVEHLQKGNKRAEYAEETIRVLSSQLTVAFGKGYSMDNLEKMRKFYLTYFERISESLIRKSSARQSQKTESPVRNSAVLIPEQFRATFPLSWTHYFHLLKIENEQERNFYEIEASKEQWSVRELQRQYNSSLYERLALSRNKKSIQQLSQKGQIIETPTDTIKHHTVLEFLDLQEDSRYSESDLERAIISRIEHFMMELGKGFLFEGRQKRFTFEGDSFFVDLVFYNRLLKCYVLIELKIGKLTHQDIGQMQMYVNFYDRKIKTQGENPTIGIILCKEENKTVVEFTLPENNNTIFAKEYKLYLPSKAELQKQLAW